MIVVLDTEVQPDYRYLGPNIAELLPESDYRVFVDDPSSPDLDAVDGVVLSGSTASVYEEGHEDWLDAETRLVQRCIDEHVPLLGICFGHQLVNQALGGSVEEDHRRATFVEMSHDGDGVLDGVTSAVPVLHSDLVTELGDGMVATATTDYNDYFCARHEDAPLWTVQFHPELTEDVVDQTSDFDPGAHSFADTNAHRVLENFAALCTGPAQTD
jgi:GMP synthase (glutamine-hydrolysing)